MKKKYLSLLVLPLALVSCGGEEITLEEAKKIFAGKENFCRKQNR